MDTIGDRIKFLRNKEKLSMEQLAEKIKVPVVRSGEKVVSLKSITSATISNAENNKHSPSLELVVALSKYFDVSLDWLVLGVGEISKERKGKELVNQYILHQEKLKLQEEYMLKAKQFLVEEAEIYLHKRFDDYLIEKSSDNSDKSKEQE